MSTDISGIASLQLQNQLQRSPIRSDVMEPKLRPKEEPEVPVPSGDTEPNLEKAISTAAKQLYAEQNVDVSNFQHEETGRIVVRITDADSGRVLQQSPADELLRFFASAKQVEGPMVKMSA